MGGIADYTGSLVCELTLDRAVAVALQQRNDRELQIFSFNLFDEHLPFTFRIPSTLSPTQQWSPSATTSTNPAANGPPTSPAASSSSTPQPPRFAQPKNNGLNLALYSTIPMSAGLASSAALEVATMLNLLAHFQITLEPLRIAQLCQQVENDLVGAPCASWTRSHAFSANKTNSSASSANLPNSSRLFLSLMASASSESIPEFATRFPVSTQ